MAPLSQAERHKRRKRPSTASEWRVLLIQAEGARDKLARARGAAATAKFTFVWTDEKRQEGESKREKCQGKRQGKLIVHCP